MQAFVERATDYLNDGWPHRRTEQGFCMNCGASKFEYHYKLLPPAPDHPYYEQWKARQPN